VRRLERDNANPAATFGNEKLHTFTRLVPQPFQSRPRRLGEAEAPLPCETAELDETPTQAVRATGVLFNEPMCR
jgi:hypothetical protein